MSLKNWVRGSRSLIFLHVLAITATKKVSKIEPFSSLYKPLDLYFKSEMN